MHIPRLLYILSILLILPSSIHAGSMVDFNLPLGFKSMHPPQFSSVRMDRIVLKGELKPDFKLKSVRIKGDEAIIRDNSFETGDIQLREGMNSMLIELTDVNGRRRLVSYSINYEPKPQSPGGGSLVDRPVLTLDMTAEGYTAPPKKKLSTRAIRRTENPPSPAKNDNLDVVFSSPYMKQVITEDKLKIGGRFNKDAGIASITVNGQACVLDPSSGTFKGPMLISPGEARKNNINCDSKDYIIMKVDPIGHSGRNELKIKITPTEGKPYEDRLIYYYYQLYVGLSTYGKTYTTWHRIINDDGTIGFIENGKDAELPYSYTQSYNKNVFSEPPFVGWEYEDYNGRAFNYDYAWYFWTGDLQGRHWYYDIPAFYFAMDNYWNPTWYGSPAGNVGPIRTINDTKLVVHTPPLERMPFIIKLGECEFLETSDMFIGVPELDIKDYRINGISLSKLCGDFERREGGGEEDIAYIVIDDYKMDVDMELKLEAPFYETCFDYYVLNPQGHRVSHVNTCNKYFYATIEDGIRGDILVDSNNDGFLGGEDNVIEQNEPGCVFWVNDDDDYDELTKVHQDDSNAVNSSGNDSSDDSINGIRDLEDFMPFNLTIPNINEWANTQKVKFYLKAEGQGKIRVFKRIDDAYLTELRYSKKQFVEKMKILLTSGSGTKNEGQILDPSWFDSNGNFYGIFEGIEKGNLKLILEVQFGEGDNKKRVVLDEAYLTLKNVRDMYRLENVRKGPTYSSQDELTRYRDIEESGSIYSTKNDKVFVWAHGYNTSIRNEGEKIDSRTDSLMVIDTVYKRMYRAGFRGPFIGLTWHGDEGTVVEFNANWINSFQTGHVVAEIFTNLRNEYPQSEINISAHSLGNNVFCYALRLLAVQSHTSTQIDNMILAEAAIPGEAFSGEERNLRHNIRNNRYYGLFGNMYGIDISVVKNKVYNTYSTTDEVLSSAFESNEIMRSLPTPLDLDYGLVENEWDYKSCMMEYGYKALGLAYAKSKYSKMVNLTFNHLSVTSNENSANHRPYGIRKHGSMMDEYYSDVVGYYMFLKDPSTYRGNKTGGN